MEQWVVFHHGVLVITGATQAVHQLGIEVSMVNMSPPVGSRMFPRPPAPFFSLMPILLTQRFESWTQKRAAPASAKARMAETMGEESFLEVQAIKQTRWTQWQVQTSFVKKKKKWMKGCWIPCHKAASHASISRVVHRMLITLINGAGSDLRPL